MKSDFEHLAKAQALLAQALGCARNSMSNNPRVTEAKNNIRHAIDNLQKVNRKTQMKKQEKATNHDMWWGEVTAGAVNMPMSNVSQEAYSRTLKQLNMMIDSEKNNLDNLENQVRPQSQKTVVLND